MTSLIVFSSRRHCSGQWTKFSLFKQVQSSLVTWETRDKYMVWREFGAKWRETVVAVEPTEVFQLLRSSLISKSVREDLYNLTFFSVLSLQQRLEIVLNHQWSFRISRDHAINELRNNLARLSTAKKNGAGNSLLRIQLLSEVECTLGM